MKRKIFFRFFAVTLASTLLMFIFGFIAVSLNAENVMRERLVEETKIVALVLDEESDFEEFKVYEDNDKFRITIFDTEGNVILESDTHAELENHANRQEVKSALKGEPEITSRYSNTFQCEMTYYAEKVTLENGQVVILRLAIRNSEASSYLSFTLPLLIIVLVVSLVLSIIISHFISANVASRVTEVGNSLKTLNKGEYKPIAANTSEPELYSVLCEINELNENTHNHILEIEREHKKLNKVLENISQGIIAVNDRREIVFANKSALKIFSKNGNVNGKEIVCLVDDTVLYKKISAGVFEDCAFEHKYKDFDLSVVIRELAKDDLKIASIIIITDITSEKALAKQRSDFFANASHELKTPVTVMQGLSELLLNQEGIDAELSKKVERIHKESVRLGSLISDMLNISRLESGVDTMLSTSLVSLGTVFGEVLEELKVKIAEKGITARIDGDATVSADPKRIYELAENLCSNAINYNKEGGTVSVHIEKIGDGALLRVSDTGIGIEKKHIPLLCQRFYRVDKSHSKKTGGTGLGLAIVKHICALYGATIEIESQINEGTSVIIKFKW